LGVTRLTHLTHLTCQTCQTGLTSKKMKAAILDIGSNSVLLLIGERTPEGWRVLTDRAAITRLGEGFEPDRTLKPHAVQRTLSAIEEYLYLCKQMEVETIRAVATAVVRKATNPQVLLQPLQERGCPVRILSEREEAEMSFLSVALDPAMGQYGTMEVQSQESEQAANGEPAEIGAYSRQRLLFARPRFSVNGGEQSELVEKAEEAWLVIDVGGGSVELVYSPPGRDTSKLRWHSLPLGALTLREQMAPSNPPDPNEIDRVSVWLDRQLRFLKHLPPPAQCVSVGGTGVNLALLWHGLSGTPVSIPEIHGAELHDITLQKLLNLLLGHRDEERARLPGVEPERAPALHIGALILVRALAALQLDRIHISTYGVRYGVLWSLD
jgi:exopolyphosphatase/guanosine-5'-triphosphate,3'-diphosphate pyrophosphatase